MSYDIYDIVIYMLYYIILYYYIILFIWSKMILSQLNAM